MKFEISKVENKYQLTPVDEYDPDLTIITERFYKRIISENNDLDFKNWELPFNYSDKPELPINLKYLIGSYFEESGQRFFKIDAHGEHKLLIYDWARDPEKPTPEEIKKQLKDAVYCYHSPLNKGFGSLYEVIKK